MSSQRNPNTCNTIQGYEKEYKTQKERA